VKHFVYSNRAIRKLNNSYQPESALSADATPAESTTPAPDQPQAPPSLRKLTVWIWVAAVGVMGIDSTTASKLLKRRGLFERGVSAKIDYKNIYFIYISGYTLVYRS